MNKRMPKTCVNHKFGLPSVRSQEFQGIALLDPGSKCLIVGGCRGELAKLFNDVSHLALSLAKPSRVSIDRPALPSRLISNSQENSLSIEAGRLIHIERFRDAID
jgi:hypothetical protein